jgi:hypothetical protein
MRTSNRLSAEYWEDVEKEAKLLVLTRLERIRDMVTEGGRMFGEIPITPEIAAQLAAMPPEPPPAPTGAAMPPMTGQVM